MQFSATLVVALILEVGVIVLFSALSFLFGTHWFCSIDVTEERLPVTQSRHSVKTTIKYRTVPFVSPLSGAVCAFALTRYFLEDNPCEISVGFQHRPSGDGWEMVITQSDVVPIRFLTAAFIAVVSCLIFCLTIRATIRFATLFWQKYPLASRLTLPAFMEQVRVDWDGPTLTDDTTVWECYKRRAEYCDRIEEARAELSSTYAMLDQLSADHSGQSRTLSAHQWSKFHDAWSEADELRQEITELSARVETLDSLFEFFYKQFATESKKPENADPR